MNWGLSSACRDRGVLDVKPKTPGFTKKGLLDKLLSKVLMSGVSIVISRVGAYK